MYQKHLSSKFIRHFKFFDVIYFYKGTCGLAVGHPLDTVKALIQTRSQHKSMLGSAKLLIKQTNVII